MAEVLLLKTWQLQLSLEMAYTPNDLIATASVDVSSNPVLDPGETGVYPYTIAIPSGYVHLATYKITAHVTITNHSGHLNELLVQVQALLLLCQAAQH
jgi:hypothetical protein